MVPSGRALVVAVAGSLVACSGESGVTPDNVTAKFASAYCASAARCCEAEGLVADPDLCTLYGQLVAAASSFSLGSNTFNAEIAAACVKAAESFNCWNSMEMEAVCRLMTSGSVPVDGGCLGDSECAQSPTNAVCIVGKCTAVDFFGRAGAPCMNYSRLECAEYEGFVCRYDVQTSSGTCEPKAPPGGQCDSPRHCAADLYCDVAAHVCAPVQPTGGACSTGLECNWDAYCDGMACVFRTNSLFVCVAPPAAAPR